MSNELRDIISVIKKIKSSGQIKKYIDFIRFPFYRNLELDTIINFEFPLTVFIGQNGSGKSSCLHALYGMPQGNTPYEFWFDTEVDPILYFDDQKKRHAFWYSFNDEGNVKREVIKARIKRQKDPNYWETSRPLSWAGMQTRKGTDRDKPIDKNVVYIDFRAELSAFDKYFYFGNTKGLKSKNKQDYIRRQSKHLNKIITGEEKIIYKRRGQYNKPIRELNPEELKYISYILGKNYLSAKFIEHSFFRNEGYSVIFKLEHANYSEAFAGSGEVAVVSLVMQVLNASEFSLIILDEPEVSLHPGAQERLKIFLLEQIKLKKHQIVLSSHSPSIIKGLPKEAIKVFSQNPNNGRFIVKENLIPEEAFYHIEFSIDDRSNIIVEDILAKLIIDGVLSKMGNATKNLFNVKFNPGGESVMKKEFISVYCRDENSKNYILFDGDQTPNYPHFDWRNVPLAELTLMYLKQQIKDQTKEDIYFSVDGGVKGGNQVQEIELCKRYLDYYLLNVFYLPKNIPEEIIWDSDYASQLIKISLNENDERVSLIDQLASELSSKKKFAKLTLSLYGSDSAEEIQYTHKLFLSYWLKQNSADYKFIVQIITKILHKSSN
jgi:predicted ATPase